MLPEILGGLAALSAGINLWQWFAAGQFPLHKRLDGPEHHPGLTLLKPLKGADEETFNCLESWIAQDFKGPVQILFGVADPNDPVCEIVRELQKLYSRHQIELVVCQPILGANAKVSTLTHLQKKAEHDIWIVSDADVFAPEDLLTDLGNHFREDTTALVNCFYQLLPPLTFGMLWEAVAVNADFWSQVCQSNSMKPMNFALGAVMAVRRESVEDIGGFESLLNQLADDYQLGKRIFALNHRGIPKGVMHRTLPGHKILLSGIPVECREDPKPFGAVWSHQLRWARTIRVCQPGPYFLSILSNVTLFALLAAVAGAPAILWLSCLAIRVLTAGHNIFRITRKTGRVIEALFAPVKDLLALGIWVCSFTGNTVSWRGEAFRVKRGGELVRVE